MILMLGDSNFRNMMEEHGESLSAVVGEPINFYMSTSNESMKIQLENRSDNPKIVIIGSPLNEIVAKYNDNKKKGRAETIREVLEEQNKLVRQAASANENVLFLLVPPFLRLDPVWIKERIALGVFHVKDFVGDNGPWNIVVANPIKLSEADVGEDKVHLNKEGKEKLRKSLEGDILICKENLGEGENFDWASQLSNSEAPAPSTIRKRQRAVEEEEDMEEETEPAVENSGAKKARLDTMLDKMDMLMKELKEDRASTKTEVLAIANKVEESGKEVKEIGNKVTEIENKMKSDISFSAEVREDLDSLENENLKNTIIVRKLKGENVPKEKKALRAYIQNRGRELVKDILSEEEAKNVRYAAPLFSYIDPTKRDNKPGLVTPFKMGFASKDIAIKFRETAVKKSKEEGSQYKDTYFTFYQSFGTKVRSILLWGVVDLLKSDDKQVWVNQAQAKPTLQVKEGGRIVKTLNFVTAMTEHGNKLPEKVIEEATKVAKKHFAGKLEKTFIVLKD
jgi:hypothetical protein